jgi:hypothetical protein
MPEQMLTVNAQNAALSENIRIRPIELVNTLFADVKRFGETTKSSPPRFDAYYDAVAAGAFMMLGDCLCTADCTPSDLAVCAEHLDNAKWVPGAIRTYVVNCLRRAQRDYHMRFVALVAVLAAVHVLQKTEVD